MKKYDWDAVVETAKEVCASASDWHDLAARVSARMGNVPRKTLREGLARECETDWASFSGFRNWALGLESDDESGLSALAEALLRHLTKQGNRDVAFELRALCDTYDRSPSSVLVAARELHDAGYAITVQEDSWVSLPSELPPSVGSIPMSMYLDNTVFRFGLVSDTHLCNCKTRLDTLNALYDLFATEGLPLVLHGGNIIDGECRYNRHELVAHGVEGQIAYLYNNYPRRTGLETHFITGKCHEGWYASGIGFDIGRHIENQCRTLGRDDLKWIGHIERDIQMHPDNPKSVLRIMHPGGGTPYATSYPLQKIIESWQGGEKPSAAVFGHFHKTGYFYPREVHCWHAGTGCDQTSFMRTRKLAAHVGGWIIGIHMNAGGGITRVDQNFFPFYDQGYYQDYTFLGKYAEDAYAD